MNNNQYKKIEEDLEETRLKFSVLERIYEITYSSLDIEKVLNDILLLLSELIDASACSILLRENNTLKFIAVFGGDYRVKKYKIKIGEGIAGWVAKTGIPLIVNHLEGEKRWLKRIAEEEYKTKNIMAIPLKSRNSNIVAVLEFLNKEGGFSEENIHYLSIFNPIIVSTIENINLHIGREKEIKKLKAMVEVSQRLGSTLNLNTLLKLIMEIGKDVLNAEASSIFQIDEEKKELYFVTATGKSGKKVKTIKLPWGKGIAGWVAQKGKTVYVEDVKKDKRFYQKVDEKSQFKTKSIIAVPIKTKNKILGVAEVLNKRGGEKFIKEDIEIFEAIAKQAGLAMENASLYQDLDELFRGTIRAIVKTIEAKDEYTRGHTERVTEYSLLIGDEMGLSDEEKRRLEISALLHDVGKIGIPDAILGKPGKLTDKEFDAIKSHPKRGAEIMSSIKQMSDVLDGIKYHHERYDGKGYPERLKDDKIPAIARIICVADAFDAMTTDRPYRQGLAVEEAKRRLIENKWSQFDGDIVDTFIGLFSNKSKLKNLENIIKTAKNHRGQSYKLQNSKEE